MSSKLEEIRKLNREAWALCKKDSAQAIQLASQAEALLSDCPEATSADEFECLKTQTYCLDVLNYPEQALPIGLKANQLAEEIGDKSLIGSIQSLLGRIYWHIDDFATAMDYYLKALNLVQTETHHDLEVSLINGLGLVQYGLENYPEALNYFQTCLEKAKDDDLTGRADAHNNIAYVLHILGRDCEALENGMTALALFERLGTSVGKMETLQSLGAIHSALGNFDEAMNFLGMGIELSRRNNSQILEISYVLEMSRIYRLWGELDRAERDLCLALQTAEKIKSLTNISLIHEQLVALYKDRGDYKSALAHFEAFHVANKKIFNEKSDRRIKNLEITHQIEIARRQTALFQELAGTDYLTRLLNRRRFLEVAENALRDLESHSGKLGIILLDVDHFKRINDIYGHIAGDEVLKAVASVMTESLRAGDYAGRYGGEEFVVLMVGATSAQCCMVAERIRQMTARQQIKIGQAKVKLTVSLGTACINSERVIPLDSLIDYADQALYKAKHLGRNRVVAWEPSQDALQALK